MHIHLLTLNWHSCSVSQDLGSDPNPKWKRHGAHCSLKLAARAHLSAIKPETIAKRLSVGVGTNVRPTLILQVIPDMYVLAQKAVGGQLGATSYSVKFVNLRLCWQHT